MGGYFGAYAGGIADRLDALGKSLGVGIFSKTAGEFLTWDGSALSGSCQGYGLATTSTTRARLANTTAATAGTTVQYSPTLVFSGTAWNTTSSVTREFGIEVRPASAATPTATTHFMHRASGESWSSILTVASSGAILFNGSPTGTSNIFAGNGALFYGSSDLSTGLGTTCHIGTAVGAGGDYPLGLIHRAPRSDGANNVVCFTCYDRGASAITNANTMRLHSFGWTNDSNVYAEVAAVYANGVVGLPAFATDTTLPAAGTAGRICYVSDGDAGSACFAVDDGSNWKVVSLGATCASS